ncbi:hypothetical protein ABVT39_005671 [Epinephelus coioides]
MASLERKRKVKFDPMELEVLVEEANQHLNELQQRNLTVSPRNAIWEEICDQQPETGEGREVRTAGEFHLCKRKHK